jgi:tRNA (cytidine/uridine-2'-O-)-methyltransferase
MQLNVVLVEPEIPQNTGNIARTCAVTGATLHLVQPLGFSTSDKYLKRAGLDYWNTLNILYHESLERFLEFHGEPQELVLVTKKGGTVYSEYSYPETCFLLFGKETAGLPEWLLERHPSQCIRIPMREGARSLNLSSSAAVVIYEVLRQYDFPCLERTGYIDRRSQCNRSD